LEKDYLFNLRIKDLLFFAVRDQFLNKRDASVKKDAGFEQDVLREIDFKVFLCFEREKELCIVIEGFAVVSNLAVKCEFILVHDEVVKVLIDAEEFGFFGFFLSRGGIEGDKEVHEGFKDDWRGGD
jgi:hypothetical protein